LNGLEVGAVDVFLKREDISEESKRKLLVDNTARFYGLEGWKRDRLELRVAPKTRIKGR
jgi:hypothetical protein